MRNPISLWLLASAGLGLAGCTQFTPHAGPGHHPYGYEDDRFSDRDLVRRINDLHQEIHRQTEFGRLSPRQAARLNREVDALHNLYARYRRNGISRSEHYELQRRIDNAERLLSRELRRRY